uniref:Uncharacterized protein n=1 Tax=Klebsiella pneumoniae subsp. pneumoniae TaxID=72407 RepID=A0A7T7K6M7_KLEPN|nr:hypothetical protein [Klebsiella pneumoniae subsp. pneumoniae]
MAGSGRPAFSYVSGQSKYCRISSRTAITALDTATTARRTTINKLIIRLLHTEQEHR